ncbi:MAG TPA: DUF4386 domain-containing protein [Chryseolinea sp.]|nr:DUF4386 domain-containing protein [Chryseolinea sp.]
MEVNRNVSIVTGVLFIVAAASAIAGLILYGPILNDPEYIVKTSANETQVLWGAFFEIVLAFAVIGTSITLFPILRKYNESMAIGTVCFRLFEAVIILVGVISLLSIVTLRHEFTEALEPSAASFVASGKLLVAVHNWTFLYGPNLVLGPSTLMTSYLLYKSNLVPRFISVLGLIGGPLISSCAVLVTFGVFSQISAWGVLFAVPVFFYEMSLAMWLMTKGFKSTSASSAPVQNLFKLAAKVRPTSREVSF